MGDKGNSCFNNAFKSKSKKTLDKLSNKISFVEIDKLNDKEYLHYCSFSLHKGTIGINRLYEKGCLNGCTHYKRFILENQQEEAYNEYYNIMLKMRGKPEEDSRESKPRKPRKEKKEIILQIEETPKEKKEKIKLGANPYVPKEEIKKQPTWHRIQIEHEKKEKKIEKLEKIASNPSIIGITNGEVIDAPYITGSTNQYDIMFAKDNKIYIFKHKQPPSTQSKKITRNSMDKILEDTQKIFFDTDIQIIYGDENKITQKRKGGTWNTTLQKLK